MNPGKRGKTASRNKERKIEIPACPVSRAAGEKACDLGSANQANEHRGRLRSS